MSFVTLSARSSHHVVSAASYSEVSPEPTAIGGVVAAALEGVSGPEYQSVTARPAQGGIPEAFISSAVKLVKSASPPLKDGSIGSEHAGPAIYKPLSLKGFKYSEPQLNAAEELRREGKNIVGFALARQGTSPVPICIERCKSDRASSRMGTFVAHNLDGGEPLGQLLFYDSEFSGRYIAMMQNFTQADHEEIGQATAPRRIQNVGVALIGAAVQGYRRDRPIYLTAVGNTPSYYHKLGFRPSEDTSDMYLSEEARGFWEEGLEENAAGAPPPLSSSTS